MADLVSKLSVDPNAKAIPLGSDEQPLRTPGVRNLNLTQEKNPLQAFIAQGVAERPQQLAEEYGRLRGSIGRGNFARNIVGAGPGSDMLSSKISGMQDREVSDATGALERQLPFDYAQRQQTYQKLADANLQSEMMRELTEADKRAMAEAKKAQLQSGLFGLAGAGAGALIGGPAGAQVGAGAGSMLGGLL